MGKLAIVLGGTGLVGRSLVNQLVDSDHISKIITLTRNKAEHASLKVNNHIINFDKMEDHESLFRGDLFFSCLGTTLKEAGSVEARHQVDLIYQYKAASLASGHEGCHYLLVSASGANSKSKNSYLQMKGELEEKVQALPFKRISLFQPSLLIGKRDTLRVGEAVASRILPFFCKIPGLNRYRPIRGDQVAEKMVHVSLHDGPKLEWFQLDELFINSESGDKKS